MALWNRYSGEMMRGCRRGRGESSRIGRCGVVVFGSVTLAFIVGCGADKVTPRVTDDTPDDDLAYDYPEWDLPGDRPQDNPSDDPDGSPLGDDDATDTTGVDDPDAESDSGCEDGLACTVDRLENGACVSRPQPGFCVVAGRCYAAGDRDPAIICRACDPEEDPFGFTRLPARTPCDDGSPCTLDDYCDEAGTCRGGDGGRVCNDGVACTFDACEVVLEGPGAFPQAVCRHEVLRDACVGVAGCESTPCFCDPEATGGTPERPVSGCRPGVCTPNRVSCGEDGRSLLTCDGQGGGYIGPPQPCPSDSPICVGGRCVPCRPGESRCTPEGHSQSCSANGTWNAATPCADPTPMCADGICRQCQPGSTTCVGESELLRCAPEGVWRAEQNCVGGTPICSTEQGMCVECRPGDRDCRDGVPRECGPDGMWRPGTRCGSARPVCLDGICAECQPGEWRCQGDRPQRCADDGVWGASDAPCPLGCLNGRCTACIEDQWRCLNNAPEVCVQGEWLSDDPCSGATPLCRNGDCVQCVDGEARCLDSTPQRCQGGVWVNNGTACARGCLDGACADCADGQLSCSGATPRRCVAGRWENQPVCAGSTPVCRNGQCQACSPGDIRCAPDGTRLQNCSSGGAWQDGTTCPAGCANGACLACVEGSRDCVGATPRRCVNGQWVNQAACTGTTPACDRGNCVLCVEGSRDCWGKTPRQCIGGAWVNQTECVGERPYCWEGQCRACTPGQRICDLNTVRICNDAGTGFTAGQTCVDPQRCDPATGTCIDRGANYGLRFPRAVAPDVVGGIGYVTGAVTVPDAAELTFTSAFTLEAWIYPERIQSDSNCFNRGHVVIEKWTSAGLTPPRGEYILYLCGKRQGSASSNDPAIGDIRLGVISENSSGTPVDRYVHFDDVIYPGRWYHFAAAVGDSELRLYLNGQLMTRVSGTADYFRHSASRVALDEPIQFGRLDKYQVYSFEGVIDEVRLSRGVRYPDRFNPSIYHLSDADTLGLWHFDEGSGTQCRDSSGRNRHATITNGGRTSDTGIEWTPQGVPESAP